MQRTLGEFRFHRVVAHRPGDALVYEFTHGAVPGKKIWVAWSPTGNDRTSTIDIPAREGRIVQVEQMPLAAGSPEAIEAAAGASSIPIGESPVYVFLETR